MNSNLKSFLEKGALGIQVQKVTFEKVTIFVNYNNQRGNEEVKIK